MAFRRLEAALKPTESFSKTVIGESAGSDWLSPPSVGLPQPRRIPLLTELIPSKHADSQLTKVSSLQQPTTTRLEPPLGSTQDSWRQAGEKPESTKRNPLESLQKAGLWLGQSQAQRRKLPDDLGAQLPESAGVICEQEKVVCIPEVVSMTTAFGQKMIHFIQVEVSPPLGGKISNGKPTWARCYDGPVIARKKVQWELTTRLIAFQNPPYQLQHMVISNEPA